MFLGVVSRYRQDVIYIMHFPISSVRTLYGVLIRALSIISHPIFPRASPRLPGGSPPVRSFLSSACIKHETSESIISIYVYIYIYIYQESYIDASSDLARRPADTAKRQIVGFGGWVLDNLPLLPAVVRRRILYA